MLRTVLGTMLLGIFLVGCSADPVLGEPEVGSSGDAQVVLDLNYFVEIPTDYSNGPEIGSIHQYAEEGNYSVIVTDFMVPKEITEAEVAAHADYFIEEAKKEYSDIFIIILHYYDDEVYREYGDCAVASMVWGPNGATFNMAGVDIGDYSQHTISLRFNPLDLEYELTEEEKLRYDAMQRYSLDKSGEVVYPLTYPSSDEYMDEIYGEVAQLEGVTYEEVAEVREKATWRRFEEISENNYVD